MTASLELQDTPPHATGDAKTAVITSTNAKTLQRQSYYRSRLYTSKIGINPLITAAHPIFSIIERINLSQQLPEQIALHDNLEHELKAFTTKAKDDEYHDETIIIAHYLLCATIDEALKKLQIKNNEVAQYSQLLTPHSQDEFGPEQRVFQILDRIIDKPDSYLDLIELLYLCLRSGFEGKFLNQPNSKLQLDEVLEKIYQVIKRYRKEHDELLFVNNAQTAKQHIPKQFPWKKLTISLVVGLIITYSIANLMLSHSSSTVMMQLANLSHRNQHENY